MPLPIAFTANSGRGKNLYSISEDDEEHDNDANNHRSKNMQSGAKGLSQHKIKSATKTMIKTTRFTQPFENKTR